MPKLGVPSIRRSLDSLRSKKWLAGGIPRVAHLCGFCKGGVRDAPGLGQKPEEWRRSSFRHCLRSVMEIESQWTARKRERLGVFLALRYCECT
jgi:hypothetical protein